VRLLNALNVNVNVKGYPLHKIHSYFPEGKQAVFRGEMGAKVAPHHKNNSSGHSGFQRPWTQPLGASGPGEPDSPLDVSQPAMSTSATRTLTGAPPVGEAAPLDT
jgi:hypothetical protein